MNRLLPLFFAAVSAVLVFAGESYMRPDPPQMARSLTPEQIDRIIDAAPDAALVTLPATYAKQLPQRRAVATNALARAAIEHLRPVIDDSRRNIPELSGLSDADVAMLYLLQMKKSEPDLRPFVPTNTIEYYIGAGMRMDLLTNSIPAAVPE